MADIALQLELETATTINSGENVLFDNIAFTSGNITYNPVTGIITFLEAGRFSIDWWLATQSSQSTNGTSFALVSSQSDSLAGNSPLRTGEVYGAGIIEVVSAPVTLSLVNISTGTVFFAQQVPLRGSLVIIQEDVTGSGDTGPTGPTGPTAPLIYAQLCL